MQIRENKKQEELLKLAVLFQSKFVLHKIFVLESPCFDILLPSLKTFFVILPLTDKILFFSP